VTWVDLRHLLGGLAHRLAGGRLGDGRRDRHEVARRMDPSTRICCAAFFARESATSFSDMLREWRIGTLDNASAPPAMTTSR